MDVLLRTVASFQSLTWKYLHNKNCENIYTLILGTIQNENLCLYIYFKKFLKSYLCVDHVNRRTK